MQNRLPPSFLLGCSKYFLVSPLPGGNDPMLTYAYFSDGWFDSTTNYIFLRWFTQDVSQLVFPQTASTTLGKCLEQVPELPELKSAGAFLKFGWVFKATFSPGRKTRINPSFCVRFWKNRALELFHRTFLIDFFHDEGRKVACVDGFGETECYLDNTRGKQWLGLETYDDPTKKWGTLSLKPTG